VLQYKHVSIIILSPTRSQTDYYNDYYLSVKIMYKCSGVWLVLTSGLSTVNNPLVYHIILSRR